MSVLLGFSTQELELELIRRKHDLLQNKVQAVYEAVQEAENIARGHGETIELRFGTEITLIFNPETEDWEYD